MIRTYFKVWKGLECASRINGCMNYTKETVIT